MKAKAWQPDHRKWQWQQWRAGGQAKAEAQRQAGIKRNMDLGGEGDAGES